MADMETPASSRKGKAKARTDNATQNTPQITVDEITEQQVKEKRRPRKLERRSVVLQEPVVTLDTRVERLERQFASLSSRVDTVEVRQVRRPTAHTYRRSSSTSTRATSAPRVRRRGGSSQQLTTGWPSLAEQLRESQRLRRTHQRRISDDNNVEEIPRSALTSTQSRQVALAGQYNIPLPSNLSAEDIVNIKSGLTAAGSIARSLATAFTAPPMRDSSTPRAAGTNAQGSAGEASRSGANARSSKGKHDSTADQSEQDRMDSLERDDNKENLVGGTEQGNVVVGEGSGYAQPEEHDVIGAENASMSWRSFIWQAGGVVANAAKDAAVEFSTQQPIRDEQAPPEVLQSRPYAAPSARPSGVRSSSTKSRRTRLAPHSANSGLRDDRSSASTEKGRPKASRTSSRASSRI